MLRSLILSLLRIIPPGVSRRLKQVDLFRRIYQVIFHRAIGKAGEIVEVRSGPMAGVKLVTGPPITHAQINGMYELDVVETVDRLLKPGWVCYDLGASTGYLSLLMARKASRVYSFEPTPHAAEWIRIYADANKFRNIEIIPEVVSDTVKTVVFAMTRLGYGSQIVTAEADDGWEKAQRQTITLDQFAAGHELPDLMKLDVEGEEGRVLAGARRILREKRPVVCCEVHDLDNARAVETVMKEMGYGLYTLSGQPFQMPTSIYPGDFHVLCLPDQPPAQNEGTRERYQMPAGSNAKR